MYLCLFAKNNCPLCAPAKGLYDELERLLPAGIMPVLFNVDEDPAGLALFRLHEFQSTPTIALMDEDAFGLEDEILLSWTGGKMPTADQIVDAVRRTQP